jgi:hypothetical protein
MRNWTKALALFSSLGATTMAMAQTTADPLGLSTLLSGGALGIVGLIILIIILRRFFLDD